MCDEKSFNDWYWTIRSGINGVKAITSPRLIRAVYKKINKDLACELARHPCDYLICGKLETLFPRNASDVLFCDLTIFTYRQELKLSRSISKYLPVRDNLGYYISREHVIQLTFPESDVKCHCKVICLPVLQVENDILNYAREQNLNSNEMYEYFACLGGWQKYCVSTKNHPYVRRDDEMFVELRKYHPFFRRVL